MGLAPYLGAKFDVWMWLFLTGLSRVVSRNVRPFYKRFYSVRMRVQSSFHRPMPMSVMDDS